MEQAVVNVLPQLGLSLIPILGLVKMFQFLMDANRDMRQDLQRRNAYLEQENRELRQALFAVKDPDAMRLATALLSRSTQTNLADTPG